MTEENVDKTTQKQLGGITGKGFKPGQSGNPAGRPIGAKGFKTIFEEAIKKISEDREIDPKSIEVELVIRAIAQARSGEYKYFKDIFDRVYGMPKQSLDLGLQDTINSVEIILKNEPTTDRGQKHNEGVPEESEGVAGEEEPDNNK